MAPAIPCLDLHFPAGGGDLPDRVSLLVDDFSPAAIHERDESGHAVWRVFLSDPARTAGLARLLESQCAGEGLRVVPAEVADEDWAARSQAHLTRVEVGRITVAPPWDAAPPASGSLVVISPSTGFGTGHHQTTRLCLRLLQGLDVAGRRVVDLGTGSGVLALAAVKLGAAEVEALDYDEDALANARVNLELNGVTGGITLRHADLRVEPPAPADIVLANLTGALVVAQAGSLLSLVRPGGSLVVSGFLTPELEAIAAAFSPSLAVAETLGEGDWRAVRLVRA